MEHTNTLYEIEEGLQKYSLSSCFHSYHQTWYSMFRPISYEHYVAESSWNVIAHGDAREGKWRGNWRMEWVASTLHTTSEHGVPSITTADAHTLAASSRLNWRALQPI